VGKRPGSPGGWSEGWNPLWAYWQWPSQANREALRLWRGPAEARGHVESEQQISMAGQGIAFTTSEGTGRTVVFVDKIPRPLWHPLLAGPFGERFRCLRA
jgi:hypothetical protein